MRTKEIFAFMKERHSIYLKKEAQKPKPWTKDPILQSYRFCNVYRELDTETRWLRINWRQGWQRDFWFAALVFRMVNWHESAHAIGYPLPWNPDKFVKELRRRKEQGLKVYSGAYMISTHGVVEEKATYLAKSLTKIWEQRETLRYQKGEYLHEFHKRLMACFDIGSFLAGQVIADAKYIGDMKDAPDWWTFACPGPGSKRGLKRVINGSDPAEWEPIKGTLSDEAWLIYFNLLYKKITPLIKKAKMPRLHAQDLQNCLCEFDKYERVRLGEGRPKTKYNGKGEK